MLLLSDININQELMKIISKLLLIFAVGFSQQLLAVPMAEFTPDSVCEGTQTTFVSTSTVDPGDFIVSWEWEFVPGSGFTDASGPTANWPFPGPGTFNVGLRITTNLGLQDVLFKLITVNPLPSAMFIAPEVCEGQTTMFTDASTILSGSVTGWAWDLDNDGNFDNGSASTASNYFGVPGTYTVGLEVTSNLGCVSTTAATTDVNPTPTASFTIGQQCHGDISLLTATSTISSGTVDTYNWELNGDGLFDDATGMNYQHQFIDAGSHIVGIQVISDLGCVAQILETITISPLPIPIFTAADGCEDQPISINNQTVNQVGFVNYVWSINPLGSFNAIEPMVVFPNPGTYTINMLAVNSFGCKDSTTQSIEIFPTPIASFTATEVCHGGSTVFTDQTNSNGSLIEGYLWNFQDADFSVAINPVHLYHSVDSFLVSMNVTSTNGCKDTANEWARVWPNPVPAITAGGPQEFCDGDSVELSVSPIEPTILWSTGETSESIWIRTNGNFDVTIKSIHNCEGRTETDVTVWELPTLTASNDTSVSLGNEVPLWVEGASFYTWDPSTYLNNENSDSPESDPLETITYTVTGEDNRGCISTESVLVKVKRKYDLQPVNLFTPNGDGKNEIFFVKNLDLYEDCTLKVYNRWGNEVYSAKPYLNDWDGSFNGNRLPEATYYYKIDCDNHGIPFDGTVSILRLDK
ncbi:MAG: gliding motility-associated-like protein [Bacteroidia bacterium]